MYSYHYCQPLNRVCCIDVLFLCFGLRPDARPRARPNCTSTQLQVHSQPCPSTHPAKALRTENKRHFATRNLPRARHQESRQVEGVERGYILIRVDHRIQGGGCRTQGGQSAAAAAQRLIEEAQDLATRVLGARLLVVHDAIRGGEHDVPKLTAGQQVVDPVLHLSYLDVKPGRNDTALVEPPDQVHHDLARPVVVNVLKLANVAWGDQQGGASGAGTVAGTAAANAPGSAAGKTTGDTSGARCKMKARNKRGSSDKISRHDGQAR